MTPTPEARDAAAAYIAAIIRSHEECSRRDFSEEGSRRFDAAQDLRRQAFDILLAHAETDMDYVLAITLVSHRAVSIIQTRERGAA